MRYGLIQGLSHTLNLGLSCHHTTLLKWLVKTTNFVVHIIWQWRGYSVTLKPFWTMLGCHKTHLDSYALFSNCSSAVSLLRMDGYWLLIHLTIVPQLLSSAFSRTKMKCHSNLYFSSHCCYCRTWANLTPDQGVGNPWILVCKYCNKQLEAYKSCQIPSYFDATLDLGRHLVESSSEQYDLKARCLMQKRMVPNGQKTLICKQILSA